MRRLPPRPAVVIKPRRDLAGMPLPARRTVRPTPRPGADRATLEDLFTALADKTVAARTAMASPPETKSSPTKAGVGPAPEVTEPMLLVFSGGGEILQTGIFQDSFPPGSSLLRFRQSELNAENWEGRVPESLSEAIDRIATAVVGRTGRPIP